MRNYSKYIKNRQRNREGYSGFYEDMVAKAKGKCCENCGIRLRGSVSEIAHILPKTSFKSVSKDEDNILFLCSWDTFGTNNCHAQYDSSWTIAKQMDVWPLAIERYKLMEERIEETNLFKTLMHFDNDESHNEDNDT